MNEYYPLIAKWKMPLLKMRAKIVARITNGFNYFHIRHEFSLEERKRCDLYFITHYHYSHEDDQNASLFERLRYKYYWRLYGYELREAIDAIKGKVPNEVNPEVEAYVSKWQAFSQTPAFVVEMIHGINGERLASYDYSSNKQQD